jgi:hypothetical protein
LTKTLAIDEEFFTHATKKSWHLAGISPQKTQQV